MIHTFKYRSPLYPQCPCTDGDTKSSESCDFRAQSHLCYRVGCGKYRLNWASKNRSESIICLRNERVFMDDYVTYARSSKRSTLCIQGEPFIFLHSVIHSSVRIPTVSALQRILHSHEGNYSTLTRRCIRATSVITAHISYMTFGDA